MTTVSVRASRSYEVKVGRGLLDTLGAEAAALLKLPGHIIPTESPQRAQPARLNAGDGEREINK